MKIQPPISTKPLKPNLTLSQSEVPVPKPKPQFLFKPNERTTSNTTVTTATSVSTTGPSQSYARPRPKPSAFAPNFEWNKNINIFVPPPPQPPPLPPQRPARPAVLDNNNITPQDKLAAAMTQSLKLTPPSQQLPPQQSSSQQSSSQQSSSQQLSLQLTPQSSPTSQWHQPKVAATRNVPSPSSHFESAAVAITPPNVSVTTNQITTIPQKLNRITEKKERSSFIKRLTGKPKRKINRTPPSQTNFSCDNPTFYDTSPPNASTGGNTPTAPIHIRSGSCPNQSNSQQNQNRQNTSFDDCNVVIKNNSTKQSAAPPLVRERFRCVVSYPPNSEYELELKVGDIVYVHKKRDDGWYKGTLQRTGKTGLFPGPFVESF